VLCFRDSKDRAERAQRESEYFAAMADEVAGQAKLDDDVVAGICTRVRAALQDDGE
jgi:hypothetical protein